MSITLCLVSDWVIFGTDLLDSKCLYFKEINNGIGCFAHIYSEAMEPEYGVLDDSGKLNFPFSPKTSC